MREVPKESVKSQEWPEWSSAARGAIAHMSGDGLWNLAAHAPSPACVFLAHGCLDFMVPGSQKGSRTKQNNLSLILDFTTLTVWIGHTTRRSSGLIQVRKQWTGAETQCTDVDLTSAGRKQKSRSESVCAHRCGSFSVIDPYLDPLLKTYPCVSSQNRQIWSPIRTEVSVIVAPHITSAAFATLFLADGTFTCPGTKQTHSGFWIQGNQTAVHPFVDLKRQYPKIGKWKKWNSVFSCEVNASVMNEIELLFCLSSVNINKTTWLVFLASGSFIWHQGPWGIIQCTIAK